MGRTGRQCVHKGAVIVVLRQRQGLIQHLHGLQHLLAPLDQLAAILHRQGAEEVTGQNERVGLDAEQLEPLLLGDIAVGLCHGGQPIVGHLAQRAHMTLQHGDIGVGVEQLWHVEDLARARVVVIVVVRQYLHQLGEVRHVQCQLFLGAVDPCLHGVVRIEKRRLVHIGVDDLVGADQVASSEQHGQQDDANISHFSFEF